MSHFTKNSVIFKALCSLPYGSDLYHIFFKHAQIFGIHKALIHVVRYKLIRHSVLVVSNVKARTCMGTDIN